MPKLVTAILCKDERDRYLERVLRRCLEFSDVLVLDDGSTDGSPELAESLGCNVRHRSSPDSMWGQEAPARAELWQAGAELAGDGWLLIADADQLLHGDPRPLCRTTQLTAWAFPLYDCWNDERYYRADGFWQGYKYARPWLFRPSALREPAVWPARGLHTGHAPANFPLYCGVAPFELYYWSHLAYVDPAFRKLKYERYMAKADQLNEFERAHVASILD